MKKDLAIVLVNFNGAKDTIDCVESIRRNSGLKEKLEIIIVDNKSNIDDRKKLEEKLKNEKIILSNENLGFAKANNIGIKCAMKQGFNNILLLNNDTLVEKNSLEKMLDILQSDRAIGAVSCSILYEGERDKIWFDGGSINWNRYMSIHKNQGSKFVCKKEVMETKFITGCCIMLRRDVIENVGVLPTEYFMYFEDTDFSTMILDRGYKLKVIRDAIIYHKVSASTGGEESNFSVEWGARNRIIFMKKYKKKSENSKKYLMSYMFYFSTRIIKIFGYFIKGESSKAKSLMRGIKKGLKYNKINS